MTNKVKYFIGAGNGLFSKHSKLISVYLLDKLSSISFITVTLDCNCSIMISIVVLGNIGLYYYLYIISSGLLHNTYRI